MWRRDPEYNEHNAIVNGCHLQAYRVAGAGWHWSCARDKCCGTGYVRTLREAKEAAEKAAHACPDLRAAITRV